MRNNPPLTESMRIKLEEELRALALTELPKRLEDLAVEFESLRDAMLETGNAFRRIKWIVERLEATDERTEERLANLRSSRLWTHGRSEG